MRPFSRPIAPLLMLAGALLSSCTLGQAPVATALPSPTIALPTLIPTVGDKAATASPLPSAPPAPTATAPAGPAPTLAITVIVPAPTTAPAPTIAPTAAPPTATPNPASQLVGPEWSIAAIGDLNQDGQLDVVAYKPIPVTPRQPRPEFPIVAGEIVVVQQGANGPELQLAVNPREVIAPGAQLARFPDASPPAAFMLQVGQRAVGIVPLNAAGDVTMIGAALTWGASGYRPQALASSPAPTAPGIALVGAEWQVVLQADLNGNGRREVAALKPGPAVTLQGGYTQSAREVVVVEESILGRAELQLALNTQSLITPMRQLVAYPAQLQIAGFMTSINQSGTVLSFTPFDAAGKPLTRGARIAWDAAAQSYRATADSELLPPPPALLGSEWTVLADGDANGDGRRDLIAYKPAGIQVRQPNPAYRYVAAEFVIAQVNAAGPYGPPEVQLIANPTQILAPGTPLFNYATSDPNRAVAAFLLNVTPTGGTPLALIPVSTGGLPLNDLAVVAYWDAGQAAYRLRAAAPQTPTPQPTPQLPPLVGAEWVIVTQGDFNADGRRDVLAYKPAAIVPTTADPGMTLVARELVIVQEGVGGPELQLGIGPSQVIVPGRILFSYAQPAAAFQFGIVAGRTGAIAFAPLSQQGDLIGQKATLAWNVAQSLYLP